MGSQKVLVVLSRLGGLSIRQMTHRATDARCDQMRQRLMDQSLHWRSLSTSCPAFLKDEVVDAKSGKDSSSKPPQVEADDETRSILNDIWRDFECLPPKPNPLEGGGGKNPVVPGATKSDTSKEKTSSGPELRNILHSALANAKISYSDEDATVILDSAEEESQRYSMKEDVEYFPENVKVDQFEGLNLTRGENGVFEMEELVEVLRDEKLTDIAVITVPKEMVYTDYLVLATALSPRHARGVSEFLKKLYKRKKNNSDPTLFIEGETCQDWKVLDMGNIVLHIFLPEAREYYDIETLWTVGSSYDDLTHSKDDPVYSMIQQQIQLLQELKPKNLDNLKGAVLRA